jgi:beta-fructofuranosidase
MAADPHRPQFHFLPPANWNNDPNGPIYWKGKYHMFYQHYPYGAYWNDMHWGHAVSTDMIHWKHLPIALAPTPDTPDEGGIFTGSAVIHNGVPTILYTGVRPQPPGGVRPEVQMIATSDDQMIVWKKFEGNPVLDRPPAGFDRGWRDPAAWKDGDTWYLLIGSGVKGGAGAALLYRSKDLRKFEYVKPLATGTRQKADEPGRVGQSDMWECPDFFPLGNKHVLLVATNGKCPYFVGTWANETFTMEAQGHTDLTPVSYAAKTMTDAKGRRIFWSWIRERRSKALHSAAGWASAISLPRVLSLRADNTLAIEPLPELTSLRGAKKRFRNLTLKPGEEVPLAGAPGDCMELVAEIDPGTAEEVGIKLRATPDGAEQTLAGYHRARRQLFCDTRKSTLAKETAKTLQQGHFALAPGEPLRLRVFVDGSVLEMFANGRACLTDRMYATRADALGLAAFARGGTATVKSIEVFRIRPISKDRLTSGGSHA